MPTYYVHIPDTEAPTAEVEASSTKHARTAYLDYLSRNSIIAWQERQSTRSLIKVSQMQPGEIRTQVQLDYDMRPEPEAVIEEVPEYNEEIDQDIVRRASMSDEEAMDEMGLHRVRDLGEGKVQIITHSQEPYPEEYKQFISRGKAPAPKLKSTYTEGEEQIDTRSGQSIPNPLTSSLTSSPIAKLSRKSKGV